jgi:hypothetical protein
MSIHCQQDAVNCKECYSAEYKKVSKSNCFRGFIRTHEIECVIKLARKRFCNPDTCSCYSFGAVCNFASKRRRQYMHCTPRQRPCPWYADEENEMHSLIPLQRVYKFAISIVAGFKKQYTCKLTSIRIHTYACKHMCLCFSSSDMLISILDPQNFEYKHIFLDCDFEICL